MTRGARNPNLQVAISYARHDEEPASFILPLRMIEWNAGLGR